MPNIDELNIELTAESKAAASAIDALVGKLDKLSTGLGKINGSGLKSYANAMNTLTTAMQGIKNVNASQFTKVVKGIKQFESIDTGKVAAVSNAMAPLAKSIQTLNGLTFDSKGLGAFLNALTKLSQTDVSGLNKVDFTKIGQSIHGLSTALSGAPAVSKNTISIVNAIAKLGAAGTDVHYAAQGLPDLSREVRTFINSMSTVGAVNDDIIRLTQALGTLGSAGTKMEKTAANLGKLTAELEKFFAAMAKAPAINENVIRLVEALGNMGGQGARFGTSARGMSSGLNLFTKSSTKAQKSATSLAAAFGKFYASYWVLLRGIGKIGDSINYAAQLQEVQNVVDTTFKEYKSVMEDFAATSITDYGMSELTAKEIGSRFQAMGSAAGIARGEMAEMSVALTALTGDLASFYNEEQEDVARRLQSVFSGETEPLTIAA